MAHRHEHAHGHSHDEPHEHDTAPTRELDAAGKSLSDALRLSFFILKIIMIVLVIAFLISGFKTVDSGEKAMVLRFGAIRGVGEERVLGPGWHWVFPYPIDELSRFRSRRRSACPSPRSGTSRRAMTSWAKGPSRAISCRRSSIR